MTFAWWYDRRQIETERHKRYGYGSYSLRPAGRNKRFLIIPTLMLVFMTVFSMSSIHATRDVTPLITPNPQTFSGPTVYVAPSNGQLLTVGSTFSIQVKVANMAQFNGWDIEVFANPSVITATSLSITGNDFSVNASSGTPFEIVHCVNGIGSGCTSSDGPGIAHSAYGNTASLTGNGLLFTVTYKVVGSPSYSPLLLETT